jgi:hypothetical protein
MGYQQALNNSWHALQQANHSNQSITYLNRLYQVDIGGRKIRPPAGHPGLGEHEQILVLHYLAAEGHVGDISQDRWISFRDMAGGDIYFPSFRKRAVDRILDKYGGDPPSLFAAMPKIKGLQMEQGTAAITFYPFDKIHMAVIIWAGDEEFPPDCNILFNASIKQILCTEDTAVLAGVIASII